MGFKRIYICDRCHMEFEHKGLAPLPLFTITYPMEPPSPTNQQVQSELCLSCFRTVKKLIEGRSQAFDL